jgi:phosphopantothenoylcysteine decarboxylase/phosphopantothenate--cysteine ligase
MYCVVTAGPTYEPLDEVRRLTNFSTGRLGSELANFLTERGHQVTLLIGEQATYRGELRASKIVNFTTTDNLRDQLQALSRGKVDAVFHAAAVSDFTFGKVWARSATGEMTEITSGKISTRQGTLMAELAPTMKIISALRDWYPKSLLVGWKYEVEGNHAGVIALAERQVAECHTNACVANGRGYGPGFGLVTGPDKCRHLPDAAALFPALEQLPHK